MQNNSGQREQPVQKALNAQPSSHLEGQKGAEGLEHMSPGIRQEGEVGEAGLDPRVPGRPQKQIWVPGPAK